MKSLIVIFLFSALVAQSFSRSLILADYLVNVKKYQKDCINKAKPMLHCNGKCQMLKKMNKQQGNEDASAPQLKLASLEIDWYAKSFFPKVDRFTSKNTFTYYLFDDTDLSKYVGKHFHPPSVA